MDSQHTLSGYRHPVYAQSFAEFGVPTYLTSAGTWSLKRPIPGTDGWYDAMGLYPLLCCGDWAKLSDDMEQMTKDGIVAFSAVTDPFGAYDDGMLQDIFRDVLLPYKAHYVVDLRETPETFVSAHHQRNVGNALKKLQVEICADPLKWLDEWVALYDTLIARHNITGLTAFSRMSFWHQLQVSGLTVFRAVKDNVTVGMTLWYTHNNVSYYHLGAYSEDGYQLRASFALFWHAIEYFAKWGLQWLNLGAGAGVQGDSNDGLSRFKCGWSNGTRMAYFGGRIFSPERYATLKQDIETSYFPAYRYREFQ